MAHIPIPPSHIDAATQGLALDAPFLTLINDLRFAIAQIEQMTLKYMPETIGLLQFNLLQLVEFNEQQIRQLVDILGVSQPTVSIAVNKLIQRGYVHSVPLVSDKRSRMIIISRSGRRLLHKSRSQIAKFVKRLDDGIEADLVLSLSNDLVKLRRRLDRVRA